MPTIEVTRNHPSAPLAPIDESVVIPASVRRAAEKANSHYVPAPVDQPQPDPAPANPLPQPDPAPEPAPQPAPVAAEPVPPEQWEHRYHSMRGRYESSQRTVGELQEHISQLGDELQRTQQLMQGPRPPANSGQPLPSERALRPEDETQYGAELIDFAQRAARDAVAPQLTDLQQRNQALEKQVQTDARRRLAATLSEAVPNWREINQSDRFKAWLRLPDVYSGGVRHKLLNMATSAADAPRVIAFFKGFLAEEQATGNAYPAPRPEPSNQTPRVAAVPLDTLAAPGKARPAGGNTQVPVDKPVFTRAQIKQFYSHEGRASYLGRDADRAKDEAAIFAAQLEGRVR